MMITLKKRNTFNERPSLFTDVMSVLYRSFKSPYNWFILRRSRLITETVKVTETALITIFLKILQEDCDVDLIVAKNLFVRFKVINALAINLLTEELEFRSDPVTYTI